MYNTSTTYKTEIKKPSRSFECKITIGDRIFYNEDIVDVIIDGNIQPQEGFMVGSTTSTTLDLTLLNKGDTIYSTNQIKIETGLKIGNTIEYIPMGLYNIDDIEKTDYTTKFTCYDNMIKFETAYFSNLGDTPALTQVVNELASKTGVQFMGSLPSYTVKKLEGFTCREILSYVASLCGGNAVITRDGKFTIVYPKDINYSITADNYFDYKREEVKYKIGKVTCQTKEKETISKGSLGTDSMELIFENPWVNETILTDIYNRLNGFEYLGYDMKWQGDLSIDVGDIVICTDVKGVVRKLPILSQKLTYTGGLTSEIAAKGESKNKNSFSSSGSTANKVNRVVTEVALVNKAFIDYAHINDADIVNLKAQTAKIQNAEIEIANINNLIAGNISAGSTQTIHLTSANTVLDEALIKSGIAAKMSIGDLLAGNIDTNRFNIVGSNGNLTIKDNTIQIKDSARVRIQIGKDASNDYNMYVWDSSGKLMFDATGLKSDGIKSKIIRDDMITDNANINGSKINISSLVTEVNKDTNTQLLKASKIAVDTTGQSLEVSFNSLKSNVDNMEIGGRNYVKKLGGDTYDINSIYSVDRSYSAFETINSKKWLKYLGNTGLRIDSILIQPNTTYTWSFNVYTTGEDKDITCAEWDGTSYNPKRYSISTTPTKISHTFTSKETSSYEILHIQSLLSTTAYYFSDFKLEKGNKATDWTPAPEDIEKVTESLQTQINTNIKGIETLVKETTITEDGTSVKLQDFYSTFKQTSKDISLKVESLETMEIGGRNILRNTAFIDASYFMFSAGISLDKNFLCNGVNTAKYLITGLTSDAWRAAEPERQNVVEGRVYSASVETYIPTDNGLDYNVALEIQWFNASGARISQASVAIDKNVLNKWQRIILENKVAPAGAVKGNARVRVQRNGKLWVAKLKLEEGTKATAWSVAQEDVDSNINGLSNRMATAEQKLEPGRITQSISDAINGGTASISTVTTTLDKTGFSVKNGAIKILNKSNQEVLKGDTNGNISITGTFINKNHNGVDAIKIDSTNIYFYDWERNARELGIIYSSFLTDYPNVRGFSFAHNQDGYMTLGYRTGPNSFGHYMTFDKYAKNPTYAAPIRVHQGTVFHSAVNMQNRVYVPDKICFENDFNSTTPQIFKNAGDSRNILCTQVSVNGAGDGYMVQTNTGGVLFSILAGNNYPAYFNADTYVNGNFSASGSKNSLQTTEHYGERLINAYETTEYYFADIGTGIIKDGECLIHIDEVFQECINTNIEYHVFTQAYEGSISKIERYNNYFIVYGEEGTKFSWELKGKRRGYENVRLDTPEIGTVEDIAVFTEEDFKSNTSEDALMQELDFNLEEILMEG